MDFTSVADLIDGINNAINLNTHTVSNIPTPLILSGISQRPGLSAIKIASRIIARKSEANLPVGTLPTGEKSPDEIMERIRIEEIIKAIQEESIILIAVPPGITLEAAGTTATGEPVTVVGSTVTISGGKAIMI
jgi:hypothetical protein